MCRHLRCAICVHLMLWGSSVHERMWTGDMWPWHASVTDLRLIFAPRGCVGCANKSLVFFFFQLWLSVVARSAGCNVLDVMLVRSAGDPHQQFLHAKLPVFTGIGHTFCCSLHPGTFGFYYPPIQILACKFFVWLTWVFACLMLPPAPPCNPWCGPTGCLHAHACNQICAYSCPWF